MASRADLTLIPSLWASGGQKNQIPATQPTAANGASFQYGFPEITSADVADGGIPPVRMDFNGILSILSEYANAIQSGHYVTFDSAVSAAIGGYPKGALLWYVQNGVPQYLVASLADNNTNSTLTDTSAWQPVSVSPQGFAMLGTLADQNAAQIRNIAIVDSEPDSGVDGTIYAIVEQ